MMYIPSIISSLQNMLIFVHEKKKENICKCHASLRCNMRWISFFIRGVSGSVSLHSDRTSAVCCSCPGHKHLGIPPRTQITLFCFKKPSSVGFIAHSTSKDSDLKWKRGTDEAYYNTATWGKPGNTNIMLAKEICFDEKVFPWVINSSKF